MARHTLPTRAWRDLNREVDDLEERAGLETVVRFFGSALRTCADLADMPLIGERCDSALVALEQLRRWPIRDFENWVVFICPPATA